MTSQSVFSASVVAIAMIWIGAGVGGAEIVNPGFEDGLNGWVVTGTFASVSGPKTPNEGQYYAVSRALAPAGGQGRIEQTFTLPGDVQTLWCDIQGLVTNGRFDADLILPGGSTVPLWIQPPNTWHGDFVRHAYDVSPYAGMDVTLAFQTHADPDCSAELYIDRILLEPMPEPATLLLLALGGACVAMGRFSRR